MRMRVLVTRPQEDAAQTAALLAAHGHRALLAPLLATRWFDGPPLDLAGVAAILATSANGVRALVRRISFNPLQRRVFDIPVFAVGPQTMQEARAAGFARVENAAGDAKALAAAVPRWLAPEAGALLHACGEDGSGRLAQDLSAAGYDVRRQALYAVEALPLPPQAAQALRDGTVDAALFFSPRSAGVFLDQAEDLPLETVTAFCISPATAAVLPAHRFKAVAVAPAPNQDALLALLG
jgi:uroporphyrinogen-III synthase